MSAGVLKVAFLALTVPDDEMTGPLMSVAMTTSRPLAASKHISATVTKTMEHADNRILRIRVEKLDVTKPFFSIEALLGFNVFARG
jgi:hypothetical protein